MWKISTIWQISMYCNGVILNSRGIEQNYPTLQSLSVTRTTHKWANFPSLNGGWNLRDVARYLLFRPFQMNNEYW